MPILDSIKSALRKQPAAEDDPADEVRFNAIEVSMENHRSYREVFGMYNLQSHNSAMVSNGRVWPTPELDKGRHDLRDWEIIDFRREGVPWDSMVWCSVNGDVFYILRYEFASFQSGKGKERWIKYDSVPRLDSGKHNEESIRNFEAHLRVYRHTVRKYLKLPD